MTDSVRRRTFSFLMSHESLIRILSLLFLLRGLRTAVICLHTLQERLPFNSSRYRPAPAAKARSSSSTMLNSIPARASASSALPASTLGIRMQ